MTTPKLGRLARVRLRDVWASESSDFTPWLARPENITLLGETLQLELQVEAEEKRVGPFRADILCKETLTDRWVVIENQLECTDHSHLGQLLTYAAGLQALTVVWVAERFTDEHRAALEWLNRVTTDDVHFFALEIEAWKIGGSDPAPKFNVVCQPNEWARVVKETAQQIAAGSLSERRQAYLAFWQQFAARAQDTHSVLRLRAAKGRHYFDISLGRSGFWLIGSIQDGGVWASLACSDLDLWPALLAIKAEAEKEAGVSLDDVKEGRGQNYLRTYCGVVNLDAPDTWPPVIAELQSVLEQLHGAFALRVRGLEPAD